MKAEYSLDFSGFYLGPDGLKFIHNGQITAVIGGPDETFVFAGCPFCRSIRKDSSVKSFSCVDVMAGRVIIDLCPECGCMIPREVKQNGTASISGL